MDDKYIFFYKKNCHWNEKIIFLAWNKWIFSKWCLCNFLSLKINSILKNAVFRQNRPENNSLHNIPFNDFGMPSDHAQTMSYIMISALLCTFEDFRIGSKNYRNFSGAYKLNKYFRILEITALVVITFLVCASRVYLEYHTPEQVSVGAIIQSTLHPQMTPGNQ